MSISSIQLPEVYPDELFSSVLIRYHIHSGHINSMQTQREIFHRKSESINLELLGALPDVVIEAMEKQKLLGEWIEKHTMFPEYARFLPKTRRDEAFSAMQRMDKSKTQALLYTPRFRTKEMMRYCPVCAMENREKYGETYWHRIHQVQGVNVCPHHACRLMESTLRRVRPERALQSAAEIMLPYTGEAIQDRPTEKELMTSRYLAKVFALPITWENEKDIIPYLRTAMTAAYPLSARGELTDLDRLIADMKLYYSGVLSFPENIKQTIERMYQGKAFPFVETCLLAQFLGIKPDDLTNPVLPEQQHKDVFDETVMSLYRQGKTYEEIAELLGSKKSQIKSVCNGHYRRNKSHRTGNMAGKGKYNWETIDQATLPEVKKIIQEMEGSIDRKPQRISISAVANRLNMRTKGFCNLAQCMNYVKKYACTVEENRAKKLVWAIKRTDREGWLLNKQRVFELVHMDKNMIRSAMPHMSKYADEKTSKRIRELME